MKYQEVKTPKDLYDYMKENIKYGFISKDDKKAYVRVQLNDDEKYEETLYKS